MDFVRKYYEKFLLGIVLLGLVGALVFLPYWIRRDRDVLDETRKGITSQAVKPLSPVDLMGQSNVIQRLQSPTKLDFETTNKLFNPVEWQKTKNGSLIKIESGKEVGPQAVVITQTTPLYLIITLDSVETNELGARYIMGVERQMTAKRWQRAKQQHYALVGDKNEAFTIIAAKDQPDNSIQLILRLTDTGEQAILSKDKPFRRVDGYVVDLKYAPEGKSWQGQRVNDVLKFAGDDYIIVAIDKNEVVLSARSNQKKTALTYNP